VNPKAGLDDVEKQIFLTLTRLEFLRLSSPGRSRALYRLRFEGPLVHKILGTYVKAPAQLPSLNYTDRHVDVIVGMKLNSRT
jgi:hypothetical protein